MLYVVVVVTCFIDNRHLEHVHFVAWWMQHFTGVFFFIIILPVWRLLKYYEIYFDNIEREIEREINYTFFHL